MNALEKRPSVLGSFVRGAGSGAFSGGVMMGIVTLVAFGVGMSPPGWLAAGAGILATTLFGGVMSLKRAVFDAPKPNSSYSPDYVAMPIQTISGPALAPTVMMDAADQQPSKNWVAATGRSEGSQRNIQAILDNGAMSATDRAAAIAASRDMGAERGA